MENSIQRHELQYQSADIESAKKLIETNHLIDAEELLSLLVRKTPRHVYAWLLLGSVLERRDDYPGGLQAYYQAVTKAQIEGLWLSESTTPSVFLKLVVHAITRVRQERRQLLWHSFDSVKKAFGSKALQRVEIALRGYLKEESITPQNINQRPRLFYFPALPEGPYHNPYLFKWAQQLQDAYPDIRNEAHEAVSQGSLLESYLKLSPLAKTENYLRGSGYAPAWDALFFYRHGQRFDTNHAAYPMTSRVLASIPLCEIDGEAPEICFSVMRRGTEIMPHYGVTNARLVMHLPLIIPENCALNVFGGGVHSWREAELVLFDDTFQHEAWNRSSQNRVILLMDCWNPHLTEAERLATKCLLETISALGKAGNAREI